jgi:YfiH family protein
MLQRIEHDNGVVTWQSPLLQAIGVVHAFSTRIGGVSEPPFDMLNLGNPSGIPAGQQDPTADLAANYRLLQEALNCPPDTLRAWVTQVHGRTVELIDREPEGEYGETLDAEIRDRFSGQLPADAIVSLVPGVLLTIRVADCVPILLASREGTVVGAVHAGWRGIVGNVLEKAVRTMHEAGAPPASLLAAIGPGICIEHFEVGEEVAREFEARGLGAQVRPAGSVAGGIAEKPHIDLQAAARRQLLNAGVTEIDGNELCTFHDAREFFSHRRDHGVTGRMAAVIMARGPRP